MIRALLAISFFSATIPAYCQPSKSKQTDGYSSGHSKFPFSTAETILLISFTPPEFIEPEIIEPTTVGKAILRKEVVKKKVYRDTLGYKEVREVVRLSMKGKGELSAVLNRSVCSGQLNRVACYSPRNAVLFLDRKGSVIAELEICFQCLGFETKPRYFYIRDIRDCMYDALKKVFADAGVKYGITTVR